MTRMENITSKMVIHNHVDGEDTKFYTMSGPLIKNPMGKCLAGIRRRSYQAAAEDSIWPYKPVSDLWPDIDPDSDSSFDGSSYEGSKYQDNLDNH